MVHASRYRARHGYATSWHFLSELEQRAVYTATVASTNPASSGLPAPYIGCWKHVTDGTLQTKAFPDLRAGDTAVPGEDVCVSALGKLLCLQWGTPKRAARSKTIVVFATEKQRHVAPGGCQTSQPCCMMWFLFGIMAVLACPTSLRRHGRGSICMHP